MGESSRGLAPSHSDSVGYLHLRNPFAVAEDLRSRILSLGLTARKRIAARIAPDLAPPKQLSLALVALLVGVALGATGRYWALPFVAYGAVGLIFNSLSKRRHGQSLLAAIDRAIRPDLLLLSSDRTRAEGITERFTATGNLDFLDGGEVRAGVTLPRGERVLLSADGVIRARASRHGLLRDAEGRLLVTSSRVLFVAPDGITEMELSRIVRTDVVDELRLVVVPSKRDAPGIYFALGSAHTLAQVIRLARKALPGSA